MRTWAAASAVVALVLGLGGCGDDPAPTTGSSGDWPVAEDPFGEDVVMGGTSVDGSEVTLADGTTIDLGQSVATFVVAGDGVLAVTDQPDFDNADDPDHPTLLYATPDGTDQLPAEPDPDSLRTSPDGRFVGFIDYATAPATAVVVDLQEGAEVVRSDAGMGDADDGDLQALYDETEPNVFSVTEDLAYVKSTGPVYSFALPSGEMTKVADTVEDVYDDDWFTALPDGEVTQFPHDGAGGD